MFEETTLLMTMPRDISRKLRAAFGYLELEMPDEAWEELAEVEEPYASSLPVSLGRVDVRMRQARWFDALRLSERVCSSHPEEAAGFISRSFCLHCLGRTEEARDRLMEAPASAMHVPTYHYNLACYQCQLGDLDAARLRFRKAIGMDADYIKFGKCDPDLEPIWNEIDCLAKQSAG